MRLAVGRPIPDCLALSCCLVSTVPGMARRGTVALATVGCVGFSRQPIPFFVDRDGRTGLMLAVIHGDVCTPHEATYRYCEANNQAHRHVAAVDRIHYLFRQDGIFAWHRNHELIPRQASGNSMVGFSDSR